MYNGDNRTADWKTIQSIHSKILNQLFATKGEMSSTTDQYLRKTIECFVKGKRSITLDVKDVSKTKDRILSLIMHPLERDNEPVAGDMRNLFRRDLIELFANVEHITIRTKFYYQFSLLSLLSIIKNSSFNKITLQLGHWDFEDDIRETYDITSNIRNAYSKAKYHIGGVGDCGDKCESVCLNINKKLQSLV